MLTVYGRRDSSSCSKIFWLLDLLNEPFDLVSTGRGAEAEKRAVLDGLSPFGKVPVVKDDDFLLWESNSILRYLASRHGDTVLWPEYAKGRARIDRWMDWSAISLNPPLSRLRKTQISPERSVDFPLVVAAFRRLDAALSGGSMYMADDVLTLADIAAAPTLHRWGLLAGQMDFPELPHVAGYLSRLEADPLYRKHISSILR